jgi:hypothetical protein
MTIPVSAIWLAEKSAVALKTIPSDPVSKIRVKPVLFVPTCTTGINNLLSPADWFWAGSRSRITGLEITEVEAWVALRVASFFRQEFKIKSREEQAKVRGVLKRLVIY